MVSIPCPQCTSGSADRSASAEPSLRWAAYGVAFLFAWWMLSDLTFRRGGSLVMAALFLWPAARAWRRSPAAEHRPVASYAFACRACGHQWQHQPSPMATLGSVVTTGGLMLWLGLLAVVGLAPKAIGRGLRGPMTAALEPSHSDVGRWAPGTASDPDASGVSDETSARARDTTLSAEEMAAWAAYLAQMERDAEKAPGPQSRGSALDTPRPGALGNLGEYRAGGWGNLA